MNKLLGIFLIALLIYGAMLASMSAHPKASFELTHENIARRVGTEGILALGVAVVIITGGIDLSIGSVVGLSAVCFGLLVQNNVHPLLAAALVLACAPLIGLVHGLLITKLRLQPFLVTLCGLFIYRGLARWATWQGGTSRDVGLGEHYNEVVASLGFLMPGEEYYNALGVPMVLVLMLALAGLIALLLHGSVYGRYLYAIGANEQAARYAGINTDRYKILAYMICSFTAGCWRCWRYTRPRRQSRAAGTSCSPSRRRCWAAAACAAARARCRVFCWGRPCCHCCTSCASSPASRTTCGRRWWGRPCCWARSVMRCSAAGRHAGTDDGRGRP
jgi:ribose/xylose/arabinose/galactoside ABC-type transport system permease subunit